MCTGHVVCTLYSYLLAHLTCGPPHIFGVKEEAVTASLWSCVLNLEWWARKGDGSERPFWSLPIWRNTTWKLLLPAPSHWPYVTLMAGCTIALSSPSSLLWEIVHQVRILSFTMDCCQRHCWEPHAFLIKLPAQQPCCRRNKYARNRKQVAVYLWSFNHASPSLSYQAEHTQWLEVPALFAAMHYRVGIVCCLVLVQECSIFP